MIESIQRCRSPFFIFLRPPLAFASFIFCLIGFFRCYLYRKGWLKSEAIEGAATLCVGNLTAGGSGKTPVVASLIEALHSRVSIAVVSRGWHGRHAAVDGQPLCISDALGPLFTAAYAGDEPQMLAYRYSRCCSHWVGVSKLFTCKQAALAGARLLIVDDGFQHLALKRDINLLLIDANSPPWRDRLMPYGRLREGVSALRRADFILFTSVENSEVYSRLKEELSCYSSAPTAAMGGCAVQICSWHGKINNDLFGRRGALFCGIARPERFKETVKKLGIEPLSWRYLADHSLYTVKELELYAQEALNLGAECLVCTEKDAVKYQHAPPCLPLPLYWPRLECTIIGGAEEWGQLIEKAALIASLS